MIYKFTGKKCLIFILTLLPSFPHSILCGTWSQHMWLLDLISSLLSFTPFSTGESTSYLVLLIKPTSANCQPLIGWSTIPAAWLFVFFQPPSSVVFGGNGAYENSKVRQGLKSRTSYRVILVHFNRRYCGGKVVCWSTWSTPAETQSFFQSSQENRGGCWIESTEENSQATEAVSWGVGTSGRHCWTHRIKLG